LNPLKFYILNVKEKFMKRFIYLAVLCSGLYLNCTAVPPDPVPKTIDHEATLSAAPGTPSVYEFTVAYLFMPVLVAEDVVKATENPFLTPALITVFISPAIKPPNNGRCWAWGNSWSDGTKVTYKRPEANQVLTCLKLDKLYLCGQASTSYLANG
jgi:hypothetical protein